MESNFFCPCCNKKLFLDDISSDIQLRKEINSFCIKNKVIQKRKLPSEQFKNFNKKMKL